MTFIQGGFFSAIIWDQNESMSSQKKNRSCSCYYRIHRYCHVKASSIIKVYWTIHVLNLHIIKTTEGYSFRTPSLCPVRRIIHSIGFTRKPYLKCKYLSYQNHTFTYKNRCFFLYFILICFILIVLLLTVNICFFYTFYWILIWLWRMPNFKSIEWVEILIKEQCKRSKKSCKVTLTFKNKNK